MGYPVVDLIERLKHRVGLTVRTGEIDPGRSIESSDVNRPGLALTGFTDYFRRDRVQILGATEVRFLGTLAESERPEALRHVLQFRVPCLIVCKGLPLPHGLLEIADEFEVPVISASASTIDVIHEVTHVLEDELAPTTTEHGSLVDVYGVGLLITGRSAIGKSETALDLVERGHRLVADDVVTIRRKADNVLIGSGNDLLRHRMEIRGIGIIDIQAIFGIRSIRAQKRIEVEVHLEEWSKDQDYERHGLDTQRAEILGTEIEKVVVPIFPGKNITVICETIALNYLVKAYGYDPAQHFNENLLELMRRKANLAILARDDLE
ncbi:MAG: HPr(Ser) kinase/phosphatase [Candidatus Eisenbacteria bacterium]